MFTIESLFLHITIIILLIINIYTLHLVNKQETKEPRIKNIASVIEKWNHQIKSYLRIEDEDSKNSLVIKTILQDVNYFSIFILDKDYNYTFINNRHKQDLIEGFNLTVSKGDNIIELLEKHENIYKIKYIQEFKDNINRGLNGELFTVFEKIGIMDMEHYFMMEYVPIKHENKLTNEVLIILLGTTEYIKLHRSMVRAKETEEDLHNEKSRFIAYISHELRTTINAVIGLSNLLLKSQLNNEQSNFVNIINSSGKYLLTVLNDILNLSKLESGQMKLLSESFNLNDLIRSIEDIFYVEQRKKGVYIKFYINENIPKVLIGDALRLKQILVNLISNALKFTEKGEIQVNIAIEEKNTDLIEKCTILLKFEVIDSGIGIKEKHINNIFDKYTQIEEFDNENRVKGTGLGLAVVKKLTEAMGGEISVSSKENLGTRFVFTLPFDIKKETQYSNPLVAHPYREKKEVKILVAEDDEVNQLIISACLKSQGWSFVVVENGKAVLKELNENKYDLILMDIHMPVMNGIETMKEIEKNKYWDHIPKIALTAKSFDEYKEDLGMVDFYAYMCKPIEENELIFLLKKALKLPIVHNPLLENIAHRNDIEAGFKRVEKILDGDVSLLVELAEKVADIFSDEKLRLLEKNIYELNLSELQEFIHKAKGAILNFQLNEVVSLLDELVESLSSGDKNKSIKILQNIKEKMIPFKEKIKEYAKIDKTS